MNIRRRMKQRIKSTRALKYTGLLGIKRSSEQEGNSLEEILEKKVQTGREQISIFYAKGEFGGKDRRIPPEVISILQQQVDYLNELNQIRGGNKERG